MKAVGTVLVLETAEILVALLIAAVTAVVIAMVAGIFAEAVKAAVMDVVRTVEAGGIVVDISKAVAPADVDLQAAESAVEVEEAVVFAEEVVETVVKVWGAAIIADEVAITAVAIASGFVKVAVEIQVAEPAFGGASFVEDVEEKAEVVVKSARTVMGVGVFVVERLDLNFEALKGGVVVLDPGAGIPAELEGLVEWVVLVDQERAVVREQVVVPEGE